MPSSNLFAVSNQGRVFALQTDRTRWEELQYLGIDFKRVSAHDTVVWALGGDHQIYVYVYGTSVPIRVCEESYENQRWNPIESFTNNLLPSDRPLFSSIDGLKERKLSDIHLPSLAWNWEGPWHLQDTFEGKALDKECWTYAVDFPRTFCAEKTWKSCVRRRKWVRYRRYIALDTWSSVSSIHKDHTQEPFIDLGVGGGDVVGDDSDRLMVWAITAFGRIMVREGICSTCPEGSKWTSIPTLDNADVTCLSVGRSGRVWALTWDGSALVRTGVSREFPLGLGWAKVDPPATPLRQIAVGSNVVWGVCRDSSVWFRRGLDDGSSSYHDNSDLGTSWLQMVGSFLMVSVGPNNQVWGVTMEDHALVIRTGITPSDLTGKTWKATSLPLVRFDPDRPCHYGDESYDFPSVSDDASCRSSPSLRGSRSASVAMLTKASPGSLNLDTESEDAVSMDKMEEEEAVVPSLSTSATECQGSEAVAVPASPPPPPYSEDDMSDEFGHLRLRHPEEVPDSLESSLVSEINYIGPDYAIEDSEPQVLKDQRGEGPFNPQGPVMVPYEDLPRGRAPSEDLHREKAPSEGPSQSPGALVRTLETRVGSSSSSLNSEVFVPAGSHGSISQEECPLLGLALPEENLWVWVSGSGCWVQANNMPKWFLDDYSTFNCKEPWRESILDKLKKRKADIEEYKSYDEAIECSSWVVNGQCRYLVEGQWVPNTLELHMTGTKACQAQEAFLKLIYTLGSKKTTLIPCCSIVVTSLSVDLPAKALVSLFTPTKPLQPLPLLFSAEKDAEQWVNHISSACVQFRGVDESPSANSIWAVSSLGFIYFHDPSSSETEMIAETKAANISLDVGDGATPFLHPLERGFRPGCFVMVTGTVHENATRFHIDLMLDETTSDIALHVNPRFNEKLLLMNTREHNVWSYEDRSPLRPFARGKQCSVTILCDDRNMKVSVNGKLQHCYDHRVMPFDITHLAIGGDFTIEEVVYNYGAGDRTLCEYFWRGVGGHLRVVEAGAGGVTWGISYDSHVYTYTGACGGGIYKGNASDPLINVMSDVRHLYVWENQRWNPLTGFTYRGLPTDRKTWSDVTGRHERTKEGTKLPSRHWQWISDWTVDHHTPNGVDNEGWQYATDFPMSYHAHRYVTDLVRRRRWVRKCRISTSGPWKQMEKVALVSVSVSPHFCEKDTVSVWGVSVSNEVVMREEVTPQNPRGTRWALVPSEVPMKEVCAGGDGGVWGVSVSGQAHLRLGVTRTNPKGYDWVNIDAPDVPIKQVGIGGTQVWGLARDGILYYRENVQPLFPEGTAWRRVCSDVEAISVSSDGTLWAVMQGLAETVGGGGSGPSGVIARRRGVSKEFPSGIGWDICAGTGWSHISARIPILN